MSHIRKIGTTTVCTLMATALALETGCGILFGLEDYQRDLLTAGLLAALLTSGQQNDTTGGDAQAGRRVPTAVAGETAYAESGCDACHCADASGGCDPDAPALRGIASASLAEFI
ncbi:MAG: hypothetical protein ACE5HE_13610, partial [Phycisphaerae bacterium]